MSNKFSVKKQTDSFALFPSGRNLFGGSSYDVEVEAPEFRIDTDSDASVDLVVGGMIVAECSLVADPLRRGLRRGLRSGSLDVPAWVTTVSADLRVTVGSDTILLVPVVVTGAPDGTETLPSSASGRTEVDLGQISSRTVYVDDMSQYRLVSDVTDEPLSIVPSGDKLDVVIAIEAANGLTRFPFSDVFVGGVRPFWGHQDSFFVPSARWLLRVMKVAGTYYADLRAGRPAGAEVDPDGATVVSAEVNS